LRAIKKILRVLFWLAFIAGAGALFFEFGAAPVVRFAMTPRVSFNAVTEPTAPDYASVDSWSALPQRADLADRAPAGEPEFDQQQAPVDVFYVHPTTYVGSRWNAPVDDAWLNGTTDRVATGIQASAFNGCCAIYAPRYRQANGMAVVTPNADGDRAIDLAYVDVRRAFDSFNARRAKGRPFILAAHSQGAVLAERLLYDAISGTALRDQLVAAYLIGGRVTTAGLREWAPDVPPCESAEQVRCVVAWNARGPNFVPTEFELARPDPRDRLCTNPLNWLTDATPAPATANLGAVFLETEDHRPRKAFADAGCIQGSLFVTRIGAVPRDLTSRVLDRLMGAENYHPIEYQLFFMNLRQNAAARVAAFLAQPK
jgi:hypothetical protein